MVISLISMVCSEFGGTARLKDCVFQISRCPKRQATSLFGLKEVAIHTIETMV